MDCRELFFLHRTALYNRKLLVIKMLRVQSREKARTAPSLNQVGLTINAKQKYVRVKFQNPCSAQEKSESPEEIREFCESFKAQDLIRTGLSETHSSTDPYVPGLQQWQCSAFIHG